MSEFTMLRVTLTGEDAASFASLAPDDFVPDEIVAWIRQYDGSASSGLVVYWRGKRPDGTPHKRRTSVTYSLSPHWARVLGLGRPPSISLLAEEEGA